MCRYGLRDDQWDRIRYMLPVGDGHVGVTAKNNRLFVDTGSSSNLFTINKSGQGPLVLALDKEPGALRGTGAVAI